MSIDWIQIKMASLSLTESFARYGAPLRNRMWSVSGWTPHGELVISQWAHHYRKGPDGCAEYFGSTSRWKGPGKNEFRENLEKARMEGRRVRLVVVSTSDIARVEAGEDASKLKKEFDVRPELIGEVVHLDGDDYVVRFRHA
ncbi:MAG: hypothetical protein V4864_23395 [Pseudomonadota bacterium]